MKRGGGNRAAVLLNAGEKNLCQSCYGFGGVNKSFKGWECGKRVAKREGDINEGG